MPLAPVRFGPVAGVTTYTNTTAGRYTPSGSTNAVIKQVVFCNTAASSATVTLGIFTSTSAGSDLAAQRILSTTTVNANETLTYNTNIYLPNGSILYFVTSATTVTVTINAYEE